MGEGGKNEEEGFGRAVTEGELLPRFCFLLFFPPFFLQTALRLQMMYVACTSRLGGKSIKQTPVIDNAGAGVIASSHGDP